MPNLTRGAVFECIMDDWNEGYWAPSFQSSTIHSNGRGDRGDPGKNRRKWASTNVRRADEWIQRHCGRCASAVDDAEDDALVPAEPAAKRKAKDVVVETKKKLKVA